LQARNLFCELRCPFFKGPVQLTERFTRHAVLKVQAVRLLHLNAKLRFLLPQCIKKLRPLRKFSFRFLKVARYEFG
jgi:hypothetical protein